MRGEGEKGVRRVPSFPRAILTSLPLSKLNIVPERLPRDESERKTSYYLEDHFASSSPTLSAKGKGSDGGPSEPAYITQLCTMPNPPVDLGSHSRSFADLLSSFKL